MLAVMEDVIGSLLVTCMNQTCCAQLCTYNAGKWASKSKAVYIQPKGKLPRTSKDFVSIMIHAWVLPAKEHLYAKLSSSVQSSHLK